MAATFEEKQAQARRSKLAAGILLAVSGVLLGPGLVWSVLAMDWRPLTIAIGADLTAMFVLLGVLAILTARAER